jgi:hypothetical protein
MSCRPSGRIISPPLSIRLGENGKLYFVLPAGAQQYQSNKIRNYFIFVSRSSAVVSPTLCEKSLLAVPRSRNMIEKRTQKKFHNPSIARVSAHSLLATIDARSHAPAREHGIKRSMQTLDTLT